MPLSSARDNRCKWADRVLRFRYHLALFSLTATAGLAANAPGDPGVPPSSTSALEISEPLFRSVESFWVQQIAALGGRYRTTQITWFSAPLSEVCGIHAKVVGPFYCPGDESVYLDREFLQSLLQRGRKDGNLAIGYVIAHEVAHHIQNVIGTTAMVIQARSRSTPEMANRILLTLELQADCYAGLWARWAAANGTNEALVTAASTGHAHQLHLVAGEEMLDPLTHGSAEQRLKWFRRGFDSGRFDDCDTFSAGI
jgi:predicted metalloprotease